MHVLDEKAQRKEHVVGIGFQDDLTVNSKPAISKPVLNSIREGHPKKEVNLVIVTDANVNQVKTK